MIAIAPGKVMVAGEYSVLDGGDALVMAVNRFARASVGEAPRMPPEAIAAIACARRSALLSREHRVRIDTTDLAHGDRKLGLGSSAAGCVAALGAAMQAENRDLPSNRVALAREARRGHREAQGGGSGVDVLASAMGGVIRVSFPDGPEAEPVVESLAWPSSWCWTVLWTGVPVRTSELILAVRALRARDPDAVERSMRDIRAATRDLTDAVRRANVHSAIRATASHFAAMDELGQRSGTPIVTDAMRQLATGIEPLGAAVKPSGAGGGDIVMTIAQDAATLEACVQRAQGLGFSRLELAVDASGVRLAEGEME